MKEYEGQPYAELVGEKGLKAVQYYATWCGPCKMLKPVLDTLSNELTDVDFYRLDIDKFRPQAVESNIRSVPTIVLYKDGKEVDRVSGYQPKEKLNQWFNEHK